MSEILISGAKKACNTKQQVVEKKQVIQMYGYEDDIYVVYDIQETERGFNYLLINLRTKEFTQTDLIRPISEKFGIGYYYDNRNPVFKETSKVNALIEEAKKIAEEKIKEQQRNKERNAKLTIIGKQRLESVVPQNVKSVIVAELHEDDSEPMTDFFDYSVVRKIILGFSLHTKDLFSELRKYAANFSETAHLAVENKNYEHREKFTGGAGYYLGKSKYDGWIIRKFKFYRDRESLIDHLSLVASKEENICINTCNSVKKDITGVFSGDYTIVNYSERATAVFGDTIQVKEQLKKLGGRFNPNLTHKGEKRKGWIFSNSKMGEICKLLKIECSEIQNN